jgi:hypothetical protein
VVGSVLPLAPAQSHQCLPSLSKAIQVMGQDAIRCVSLYSQSSPTSRLPFLPHSVAAYLVTRSYSVLTLSHYTLHDNCILKANT